jgi:thioredoxin-like negative regulator of GroEL
VVDGLEKKMEGRLSIARVDIGEDSGSALAQQYGVSRVPAFIVLDGGGNVIYRKIGGKPDGDAIEAALAKIGK